MFSVKLIVIRKVKYTVLYNLCFGIKKSDVVFSQYILFFSVQLCHAVHINGGDKARGR